MLKENTIIVFADETNIRPELRGVRAVITRDYSPGSIVHVEILEGVLTGKNLSGKIKQDDFKVYALNKGK